MAVHVRTATIEILLTDEVIQPSILREACKKIEEINGVTSAYVVEDFGYDGQ